MRFNCKMIIWRNIIFVLDSVIEILYRIGKHLCQILQKHWLFFFVKKKVPKIWHYVFSQNILEEAACVFRLKRNTLKHSGIHRLISDNYIKYSTCFLYQYENKDIVVLIYVKRYFIVNNIHTIVIRSKYRYTKYRYTKYRYTKYGYTKYRYRYAKYRYTLPT
jgi:hypothetical protein